MSARTAAQFQAGIDAMTAASDWDDPLITDQRTELEAAHRRGDGKCGICGEPVDLAVPAGRWQPTLDHIHPRSKDGADERRNLQVAHRGCNSRKGCR